MKVKEWPKALRSVLYWAAMILVLLVLVPACVAAGAYILGVGGCVDLGGVGSTACSFASRVAGGGALFAGVIALVFPIIRFLQRELAVDSGPQRPNHVTSHLPTGLLGKRVGLLFCQELVCGRVESRNSSGRVIQFSGSALTLWSLYPVQTGWIEEGDELALVQQRLPFSSARLALAVWKGASNPVRGVAPVVHSFGIFLSVSCIAFFSTDPGPLNDACIVISAFVGVISLSYLGLMLSAMMALRRFVRDNSAL